MMGKEDDKKKRLYGQFAWIVNYQPTINEQHIHMGNQKVEDVPVAEEVEIKEVKAGQQKEPDKDAGLKEKKLNYKAPTIVLQRMLEGDWFDKVSTNKELYNQEWRSKLVADLMASRHGTHIAMLWEYERKRQTIKGRFLGTLAGAGVLKRNKAVIARAFLGFRDYTRDDDEKREANTFGNYIGQWRKEPYADWVIDYVNNTSQKK